MRLPSNPLNIVKLLIPITILENKMSKRNQKGYYILPFKEEDMLNDMDLLEKMEDVNWEKFKKYKSYHRSLNLNPK